MQNALIDDDAAAAAAAMNALRRAEAERAGATPIEVQRERYRILQRYAEPQAPDAGAMYATRYTGPRPNRPVVNGRAMVSREELADFQRLFGADKTLRDLLNADRMGVPSVPSAMDPRARGVQGANVAPRGSRVRPDEVALMQAVGMMDIPSLVMRGMAQGVNRVPAGRGLGTAFVNPAMQRAPAIGNAMLRAEPYLPDAAPVLLRQVPRAVVRD